MVVLVMRLLTGNNPEKHFKEVNLAADLNHLENNIKAGAEYVITHIFYDVDQYKNDINRIRKLEINIPVIAGIKPVICSKTLYHLLRTFAATSLKN